jgi:hypothetical protein
LKYIKLYEDYSDDEIKGLMGDLETIGHKHQLVKGKDFGFGVDLKGENDGLNTLYFTPEAVSFLSEVGVVKDLSIYEVGRSREPGDEYAKRVSGEFEPTNKIRGNKFYYLELIQNEQGYQVWPYNPRFSTFQTPEVIKILDQFLDRIEKLRR